jgi:hypothetical protein
MADQSTRWVRTLLRTYILKTNPYFPFLYLNRCPHLLARKAVVNAVRRHREVRAVYVRRGSASGECIPGVSDIDISIILESGLPADREFEVLDHIHARFRGLRRWFPMLGELEILSENDLATWLPATSETPVPRSWILLHGAPLIDAWLNDSPNWPANAIKFALWIYLDLIPPCLLNPDPYLRRVDMRRRTRKILRLLNPILSGRGLTERRVHAEMEVPLLVASAAEALDAAVSAAACGGPQERAGCRSVVAFADKVAVVLESGLAPEEIAAAVQGHGYGLPALPLSAEVFQYWVRKYDPYIYSSLLRHREIVYGSDPLPAMTPPGRAEYIDYWTSCLPGFLTFLRGPRLFPAGGRLDMAAWESELRRVMELRLWLDRECMPLRRPDIDAHWRREFPECARAVDRITIAADGRARTSGQKGSDGTEVRREAFTLFRSLASEVYNAAAVFQR